MNAYALMHITLQIVLSITAFHLRGCMYVCMDPRMYIHVLMCINARHVHVYMQYQVKEWWS